MKFGYNAGLQEQSKVELKIEVPCMENTFSRFFLIPIMEPIIHQGLKIDITFEICNI